MRECKSLEPLLHDYAEGWLEEPKKTSLLRHLQRCPTCEEKLKAWSAVGCALRNLPRLPAPEHAPPLAPDSEPRFALKLALALCLPTALFLVMQSNAWHPPNVESFTPYTTLHTLFERTQEQLESLWTWLRSV